MSKKYAINQTFKVHRSSLLIRWLVVLHAIAIVAAFINALDLIYKIIITAMVLVSLLVYLKREINFHGLLIRHSTALGWEVAYSENNFHVIELLASTVVSRYIIVLHFVQNKENQTILICRDALFYDEYRKLMVTLKISGLNKG